MRHAIFYGLERGAQFVLLGSSPDAGINADFWGLKRMLNDSPDCHLEIGFDDEYQGVMLERDEMQWHQDNYLPSPEAATDPRVSILGADLTGVPAATVILAECDPIRPQGELYAKALEAAGVPTATHLTPGMVHGFFGLDEVFPTATEAMTFAGKQLSEALAVVDR